MRTPITYRQQSGSFIIEALVSLLIFAISVFALLSVLTTTINIVGQSKARNDAGFIAGELISQMWVSPSVDLEAWSSRLAVISPTATANVYSTNCRCALSGTTYECAGQTAQAGPTMAVPNRQPVTVCIVWKDKADQHLYQSSSLISRN